MEYATRSNGPTLQPQPTLLATPDDPYVPDDPFEGWTDDDEVPDWVPDSPVEPPPVPQFDGEPLHWPDDTTQVGHEPVITQRRAEIVAETPDVFSRGGSFVLDIPPTPPAVWGEGEHVIWAEGEALMIAAPQGVGKTTVALQLVRARLGLQEQVLGYPVQSTTRRVLYLAMDRPAQMRRAAHRLFTEEDRAVLDDRLVIWAGPPPYDFAQRRDILAVMAAKAGADTVIVDSLKDAAIGLSEDAVGAGYNRARQQALAEGVQVLELHHTVKRGANGSEPNTLADVYGSTWLTSGVGSVVSLFGDAGDPVVRWRHLKQPATEVGPFHVLHDHDTGVSSVEQAVDTLAMVHSAGQNGLTAAEYAAARYECKAPTRAQKQKARRDLDQMTTRGALSRIGGLLVDPRPGTSRPGGEGARGVHGGCTGVHPHWGARGVHGGCTCFA